MSSLEPVLTIEFHNNGVIDSLTHAPAPAIFLENVIREAASARRGRYSLTIVSLRGLSPTEAQLIHISRCIVRHLRSDEFFTRISETGFWIGIRGEEKDGLTLAQRILETVGIDLKSYERVWSASAIEYRPEMSVDQWISSADEIHFASF